MSTQAVVQAPKRSVLIDMATRFGMEPQAFEATLRNTVVPANCSREQFAAFLLVAKEYQLNPLTKEIYAFPVKGGGVQPIVGVDGWVKLINSHPAFDGMEFEDHLDSGTLVAITCRMHRKDRAHPIAVTEYMEECKRPTEPWQKWPHRMLRHKAMIQAARYAFGFAGIVDPDEAERMRAEIARDITPERKPMSRLEAFEHAAEDQHDAKPDSPAEEEAPATAAAPDDEGARSPAPEAAGDGDAGAASDIARAAEGYDLTDSTGEVLDTLTHPAAYAGQLANLLEGAVTVEEADALVVANRAHIERLPEEQKQWLRSALKRRKAAGATGGAA